MARLIRARSVKLGEKVGPAIKNLITIVDPRTFALCVKGAIPVGSAFEAMKGIEKPT